MTEIKSSLSKEIVLEQNIKRLLDTKDIEGAFVFYIPKVGDVVAMDFGLCGHQLLKLSDMIKEKAEEDLEKEEEHEN